MRIIIVGAGIVGFNLAQELSQEGNDISIVDQDRKKIKLIMDKLDVLAIHGNACRPSVLAEARAPEAEMIIAVTERDEVNLMVCFLASKFKVTRRIARLRDLEFTSDKSVFSLEELHVDHPINTGEIIINTITKIIKTPGANNVADFADGEILLRGFDVPESAPLAGKSLEDLKAVSEFNCFQVVALVHEGTLILPQEKDVIQPGDKIYILVDKEFLPLVLPMLNRRVNEIQKVVIFGANRVSNQLAEVLEKFIPDISIIEPSLERANRAADKLGKTVVLHGSGTDPDLFNDINIKEADLFLSLSEDDETNILSALLAKRHGAKRNFVMTQDPDYMPILDSIGMDVTINPRLITISAILKHLRKGGQVKSVYKLLEGEAEVLEILPAEGSSVINKKIGKLRLPEHARVGALLRGGAMVVPNPDLTIEPGDTVIVIVLPDAIEKIEKIFGKRKSFLLG